MSWTKWGSGGNGLGWVDAGEDRCKQSGFGAPFILEILQYIMKIELLVHDLGGKEQ